MIERQTTPDSTPTGAHSKRRWQSAFATLAAFGLVVVGGLAYAVDDAEARGRGRRGSGSFGGYGFSSYYGFGGFGPYYGAHYGLFGPSLLRAERHGPEGGLHPALANAMGLAGIDLNIKPRSAEVYVDGRYVGKVSELDGQPSFLWLTAGTHELAIYKGGYVTETETVSVEAGAIYEKKLRLEKGTSTAPPAAGPTSLNSDSTNRNSTTQPSTNPTATSLNQPARDA